MECTEKVIEYMHEFLDGEILPEHEKELRGHIQHCEYCQNYFNELRRTVALVQSTSHIEVPLNFTAKVMAKLPKEKKKVSFQRWFMHHPVLTAASLFIVLMTGSLASTWSGDHQFSVTDQANLIVKNNTVIVPKGEVVKGDVTVKNGNLKVEGRVDGDVTVINGENYMASAGQVTGDIKEINEVFDWMWYHIKETSKEVVAVFE
ncbi:anti-sigma factor family protein [Cytobacillus sp. Hz8]|uniref:anti-sigma factor family protein n=1 Tax=Cytobacillus sp. Hz8 TaxID=3347168 RepID=UPI0035D548F0